jgi:hypothetical protein
MAGIGVDNLEVSQNPDYRDGLRDSQFAILTRHRIGTHIGQK